MTRKERKRKSLRGGVSLFYCLFVSGEMARTGENEEGHTSGVRERESGRAVETEKEKQSLEVSPRRRSPSRFWSRRDS